jgi:hypothetical protein
MAMTSRTYATYTLLINEKAVPVFGFGSKPSTVDPAIADGCAFWDTDDHTLWHYNGSTWVSDIGTGSLTLATGENLTITNGTFTITSGNAVLASGSLTLTSGNATLTSGNLTVTSGTIWNTGKFQSNDAKGIKEGPENKGGRSKAQKVVNILGSLAVIGAAAAETVRARMMQVCNTLTARTLSVTGNATVAGTSTLTGATDVVGALTAGTVASDATVTAASTVTAGTGVTATTGDITATTGNVVLTAGTVNGATYDFDPDQLGGIRAEDGKNSTLKSASATNANTLSKAQRVLNVFGSLAIMGSAAAETIRCRMVQVARDLAVGRNVSVVGNTTLTGTLAVTGTATLTATPVITNYSLYGSKALTGGSATTFATIACPSNGTCGGQVHYTIVADDGTDFQTRSGILAFAAANKAGTVTTQIRDNIIGADATSAATTGIVVTPSGWTATEDAANVVYLKCNAASDLTETTLTMYYEVKCQDPNTITAG